MLKSIILSSVLSLSDDHVTVYKDSAKLCDGSKCVNVLVGKDTPIGVFELTQSSTSDDGYGGDVLVFHKDETGTYAIHRLWTRLKSQKREERLLSNTTSDRFITKGCINVDDETYKYMLNYRYLVIKH